MSPQLLSDKIDDGAMLICVDGIYKMRRCGDEADRDYRRENSHEYFVPHGILT